MSELRAEYFSSDVKALNPDLFGERSRSDSINITQFNAAEESFLAMFGIVSREDLEREYLFDDARQWRFDLCHPETRIAVEIDGGVWSGGRHVRGQGYIDDCAKLNAATAKGWRVFRFPAHALSLADAELVASTIEQILGPEIEEHDAHN